jgi:hypothetical protein
VAAREHRQDSLWSTPLLPCFLALLLATQVFCSTPSGTRVLRINEGNCGDTPLQLWFRQDDTQPSLTFIQDVHHLLPGEQALE